MRTVRPFSSFSRGFLFLTLSPPFPILLPPLSASMKSGWFTKAAFGFRATPDQQQGVRCAEGGGRDEARPSRGGPRSLVAV
jgi:hypothetical protein